MDVPSLLGANTGLGLVALGVPEAAFPGATRIPL